MIRINLVGVSKQKKTRRPPGPLITTELPSIRTIALFAFTIALAGLYFLYWHAGSQHEKLQTDLRAVDKQLAALSGVKQARDQRSKELELLKVKFRVIDQLQAQRKGPVKLLDMIAQTVNSTDAVWLSKVSDEGTSIAMEGTALSPTAVANLITNLKKSGYFKAIELKETSQDSGATEYQTFSFSLTCEKQPS